MAFPRNEAETIALYELIQNRIGWSIVKFQSNAFPDAVLEDDSGERISCEFEYLSGNFKKHGHPVDGCQLIICWQDNWPEAPLPVMALEDCASEEASVVRNLLKSKVDWVDLHFANLRVSELEGELKQTRTYTIEPDDEHDVQLDDSYYDNRLEEMLETYREKCKEMQEEFGLGVDDEEDDDKDYVEAIIFGAPILAGLILLILYGFWELFKWFMLDLKGFLILLFS